MGREQQPAEDLGPEGVVEHYGDYLYCYALRYFRDSATAEDLVQETLLAALKCWGSFAGGSSRKTWLVSIMRHKIFDLLRSRSRERSTPAAGAEHSADAPITEGASELNLFFGAAYGHDDHWLDERAPREWAQSPEELVEQRQFIAAVERCLAGLPARLRQAFLLRELEGCSAEDVAERLSVSQGNARVLLHRARLLLRDCLEYSWFAATR